MTGQTGDGCFAVVETSLSDFGFAPLAAARALGLRTVFVTADPNRYTGSPALSRAFAEHVTEVRQADTADPGAVLRSIADLAPDLRGVFSLTDYNVHVAARVAQELHLPGLDPTAAATARDKLATRRACAAAGVAAPRFQWVRTPEETPDAVARVGLPCVVKPLTEAGSVGVTLCRTEREAVERVRATIGVTTDYRGRPRPPGALVEEYLVGYETSVETVTVDGHHLVVGVTDKLLGPHPYFVELGETFPSLLPPDVTRLCVGLATEALRAVGHDFGAAHVEVKITSDGPKLVEVNPRVAGAQITRLIRESTGLDLPAELVRQHIGLAPVLGTGPVRGAASRYLTAPGPGRLRAVHGVSLARRLPGLAALVVDVEPGARLAPPRSNVDLLGYLVAVGTTAAEAARRADSAVGQLSFEIDPG
ncbi:ATP-grasp domain-containing protein [Plantactinospora sonchi]|uniref:ATP-grasp domain-containing protein n=1 Tax=Plantactinospora sonchi TaxID=1544735 RepID=A0ABU7S3L7_9ACTN